MAYIGLAVLVAALCCGALLLIRLTRSEGRNDDSTEGGGLDRMGDADALDHP